MIVVMTVTMPVLMPGGGHDLIQFHSILVRAAGRTNRSTRAGVFSCRGIITCVGFCGLEIFCVVGHFSVRANIFVSEMQRVRIFIQRYIYTIDGSRKKTLSGLVRFRSSKL